MDSSFLSNKYKVSIEYIKKLEASVRKLLPTFKNEFLEDILKSFLKLELFNKGKCDQINFVTPADCKFIDLNRTYGRRHTWSFGSHSKCEDDILLGFIQVLPAYGVIVLSDKSYSIACVIVPNSTMDISLYINKCVIVKNYRVFTETCNDPNSMNSEYFYFKAYDMDVVECHHLESATPKNKICKEIRSRSLRCHIIRKSSVCLSYGDIPEIWFEIEVISIDEPPKTELMCLGSDLIEMGMFLLRGQEYLFLSSKPREMYINSEIRRVRPDLPSWKINDASLCVKAINPQKSHSKEVVLSVNQAIKNIKTKSHGMLISFKGLLICKKLVRPLGSRTKSKNILGFGTPGSYTHVLEFRNKRGKKLVLYLNNWERIQIPLGLVSGMEILVRDVAVQSDQYYKSTAFTCFEVQNYRPKLKFDTVNLYTGKKMRTDTFSYLGLGTYLPPNIIIWATISKIKIRSLHLTILCPFCAKTYCSCGNEDAHIILKLTCYVCDEFGEAILIVNDLEVLRLILNISRYGWKIWCNAIRQYGTFQYDRFNYSALKHDIKMDIFGEELYDLIKIINRTSSRLIDVKCRKMYKKYDPRYPYKPTFYCLEAKSNFSQ